MQLQQIWKGIAANISVPTGAAYNVTGLTQDHGKQFSIDVIFEMNHYSLSLLCPLWGTTRTILGVFCDWSNSSCNFDRLLTG